MKYKLVRITNNLTDYPSCKADTKAYPHLIKEVDDEMDLFVVAEDGNWYPAAEFIYLSGIECFQDIAPQ